MLSGQTNQGGQLLTFTSFIVALISSIKQGIRSEKSCILSSTEPVKPPKSMAAICHQMLKQQQAAGGFVRINSEAYRHEI